MAKAGDKAALLNRVSRQSTDLLDTLEALRPLLETATSEADSKFDIAAGAAYTRLATLRSAAKRCFDALPDVEGG